MPSKLIESLRSDLAALQKAGAIGKVTMRQFEAISPPSVRDFSAADIKRLRRRLKFSQPVFAQILHTTASTVRKWEQRRHAASRASIKAIEPHRRQGIGSRPVASGAQHR